MKYLLFYIAVFFAVEASAQDPYYWQLTDEDGLPSMTVYNIQQDSQGYIWIGTAAGLCRYDGKEFEYYRHPEQADDEIIHLKIGPYGRVWYSNLAGQLFFIEKNKIEEFQHSISREQYRFNDFQLADSVILIFFSSLGKNSKIQQKILVGQNKREKVSKNFKIISAKDPKIYSGTVKGNNLFYIATRFISKIDLTDSSYYRQSIPPVKLRNIPRGTGGPGTFEIMKIEENKALLRTGSIISICDLYDLEKPCKTFSFKDNQFLLPTDGNLIWVTSSKGGVRALNIEEHKINHQFLSNQLINRGVFDTENNLWLGTKEQGIIIVPDWKKKYFQEAESKIPYSRIRTMIPLINKNVLVGGESNTVVFFKEGKVQYKSYINDISNITSATELSDGHTLISSDETLVEINQEEGKEIKRKLHFSNKKMSIKNTALDNKGFLFVGNYNSCFRIPVEYWTKTNPNIKLMYDEEFRIIPHRTYALQEDCINGQMWIGTTQGLYKYIVDKAEPFLENGTHHPFRYSSIVQSPYDSSIWAATHGDGVIRIKDDKVIAHYTKDSLLVSNICNHLFADDYGNVWAGTNRGLQKFDLKNNTTELVNKYDGLPADEITQIAVVDSLVYVGTNKGLITFPLDAKMKNDVPPPIHITNVAVFEKDTTLSDAYDLTYEQNSVRVDFVGLAYKCRGEVQYKYRMLGIDTNWISTDTRVARFLGLSPGNYEFQVLALNEDEVESLESATVKFCINPPFWQTWWFRALTAIAFAGIVGAGFYIRYRQIRNREKFENQITELRGQALQAQMNPHFIFNSMNAIQHFLTTNDQENAMIYLARFAKLIRHIFDQSKEKTITLDRELDFLKLYVSLEKLRFRDKIDVRFEADKSVEEIAEELELPPLLIQPIIENAFKHGLFHKKGKGNLFIGFSYKNGILTCIVEDDGIGRARSKEINKWKRRNHNSSGLNSTIERIRLRNNKSDTTVDDSVGLIITDLYDKQGDPSGTRVEVNLKIDVPE